MRGRPPQVVAMWRKTWPEVREAWCGLINRQAWVGGHQQQRQCQALVLWQEEWQAQAPWGVKEPRRGARVEGGRGGRGPQL